MSNLRIDIASEFTGRPAFRQAESATNALDKAVTKLGKKLTGAFSAYKVAQFAKASVKAFAEDQKSAAVLAKTLENVNQGYATDIVENYIHRTEALYGILDEKLRPAFAQLVVATGDAAKSQKLLQTALDVSAGTGKDLESVTAALSKAYLGNTTALQRLGVGLSAAELKGKSFDQIITTLNQNFTGQAATAADTYQGKLDRLNVAFDNLKETIGKGIIDAFGQLNTDQGFNGVITKIGSLAQDISDIVLGLGVVVGKLQSLPGAGLVKSILSASFNTGLLGILKNIGSKERMSKSQPSVVTGFLNDMKKIAGATAQANTQSKKLLTTSKALTKEAKDKLALEKASLQLKQASSIFDMDQIEVIAAMLNKQTAEDYARLQLKRDLYLLQQAIDAGDAATATKLAAIVEDDYKRVQAYQAINLAAGIQAGLITNVATAASLIPKDIKLIDLDNLDAALKAIQALIDSLNKLPKVGSIGTNGATGGSTGTGLPVVLNPDGTVSPRGKVTLPPLGDTPMETFMSDLTDAVNTLNKNTTDLKPIIDSGFFDLAYNASEFSGANINPYALTDAQGAAYSRGQATITIVDNTSGLISVITDATQQASANGINTRLVRNTGNLSW